MQCKTKLVGQVGLFAVLGIATVCSNHSVQAQITPDTTLGAEASQFLPNAIVPGGQGTRIEGGATRGAHLFHSFSDFNVGELERVYFSNPVDIENIFSRVTGELPSNIFGTLGVDGAANLYFLNPNGIVFGENARLDVAGSFHASTAEGFDWGEGQVFSAVEPDAPPLLTVNVPLGLQFNNPQGDITSNASLSAGEDLTLIGNNLVLAGDLDAGNALTLQSQRDIATNESSDLRSRGGDISISTQSGNISVGEYSDLSTEGGNIILSSAAGDIATNESSDLRSRGGDISINTQSGNISVGEYSGLSTGGFNQGGNITISAPLGGITFWQASDIDSSSSLEEGNAGAGGNITVSAFGNIEFIGRAINLNASSSTKDGNAESSGNISIASQVGDIVLENLENNDWFGWSSRQIRPIRIDATSSNGQAGSISFQAGGTVILNGLIDVDTSLTSPSESLGDGGDIHISSESLNILNGAQLRASTQGTGDAGNITIDVINNVVFDGTRSVNFEFGSFYNLTNPDAIDLDTENLESLVASGAFSIVQPGALGNAGDIILNSRVLQVSNGAQLSSVTNGQGHAGNVLITATESATFEGVGDEAVTIAEFGGSASELSNNDIAVRPPSGAFSSVRRDAIVDESVRDIRGSVTVNTPSLQILNGARLTSSTSGIGNAGNVTINADRIFMSGGGENQTTPGALDDFSGGISILVQGEGDGGSININTRTLEVNDRIVLSTFTRGIGDAGDVRINASETVSFSDSFILSEVQPQGIGNGGDIVITATALALSEGAQFRSSTAGHGIAGDIEITVIDKLTLDGEATGLFATTQDVLLGGIRVQEVEDAGQLIQTAQDTPRTPGAFVSSIAGQLSDENDVDLYRIYLEGDQSFSASTVNLTLIDTQLFLLDEAGIGIYGNNDVIGKNGDNQDLAQSSLEANIAPTPNQSGPYYIAISSGFGGPLDGEGDYIFEWFSPYSEAFQAIYADESISEGDILLPEGTGANSPLSDWSTRGSESISAGSYAIRFTGIEQVPGISAPGEAGGTIRLQSPTISASRGAQITATTSGQGTAGNLEIETNTLRVATGAELISTTTGNGDAGVISVQPYQSGPTLNIYVGDDSTISSSTLPGENSQDGSEVTGNSGRIAFNAPTAIMLSGTGDIKVETETAGDAGVLEMTAPQITVDGTEVSASTEFPDGISSRAGRSGAGGDITLNTAQITFANEGEITAATSSTGQGGNIFFNPNSEILTIRGDGEISVETEGDGNAGSFAIAVPTLNLNQARLSASTSGEGEGGDITLDVSRLNLSNDASIAAETSNVGAGGSVTLSGIEQVNFSNGGQISASTVGSGAGGNVFFEELGDTLAIRGDGAIQVETSGDGEAGSFAIAVPALNLNQARLSASTSGVADGGNITLETSQLNLSDGAEIAAVTRSSGTAGSINISPYSNDQTLGINFYGSDSLITSSSLPASENSDGSEVTGDSGEIALSAPELIVLRGDGDIKVETETAGDAGELTIDAPRIIVDGVEISASTEFPDGVSSRAGRSGMGGDITLNTAQITFANEGEITAATSSTGQGGNIFFNPDSDTLTIQGNGEISVETEGDGKAGSFEIAVPTLNLNQARLSASTSGIAPGGNLQFNITQLNLNNGAEIIAESSGTASAGNISVRAADRVSLANGSSIAVNSLESGAGGRIDVTADELVLRNNSSIAAETNSGTSGNNGRPQGVFLTDLRTLLIRNSEISASTATGNAGTIEVDARESITLSDQNQAGNGGLRVEATNGGTAGDLIITTQNLLIEQSAQASVSSPIGLAGNLSIYAGSIRLDQGFLLAKTGGTGGNSADNANIVLQAVNNPSGAIFVWMENDSLISAQAVGNANGGNIDIDAGDGFIIATHLGNSDIIATAEEGSGGNINLASFFTIGLAEASPDLSFDDLRSNSANDISASSEFGQQGSVLITNLGFDPGQGITELPATLLDASSLAEQSLCEAGVGSEFTVTGRGGLPSTPIDALSNTATWEDWSIDSFGSETISTLNDEALEIGVAPAVPATDQPIIEAQGWTRTADGRVTLVTDPGTVSPDGDQLVAQNCRQLRQVVLQENSSS